jgi:flavin reductase (DIM6/NTAB) family NADH-FMN oxidoreductase RutF
MSDDVTHDHLDADSFKRAFRTHPAGVAVITANPGSGPVGLTATSVASVSAEPPILIFSVADASSSTPAILESETVVVHLLDADNLHHAQRFATSGIDRFADKSTWSTLETGEPRLTGVATALRGRIVDRLRVGTSTVIAALILDEHTNVDTETRSPLVYHDRAWHRLDDQSRTDAVRAVHRQEQPGSDR